MASYHEKDIQAISASKLKTKCKFLFFNLYLAFFATSSLHSQEVNIPDIGLERVIRIALNKPVGNITQQDMENLIILDASSPTRGPSTPSIRSLKGLEAAVNLKSLNLSNPIRGSVQPNIAITDWGPLLDLPALEVLDLSENELTELILPDGLRNLTELNLYDNELSHFSLPQGMHGLRSLNMRGNRMISFSLTSELDQLSELNLSYCQLTDFSFLAHLKGLKKLNLEGNRLLTSVLPEDLKSLSELNLAGNGGRVTQTGPEFALVWTGSIVV
ncbi:protein phosphatase 1 regulatory subunit 42 [bacterium]|nr:protein phosphatase 1 regulatory subunit 42 [bacterium]